MRIDSGGGIRGDVPDVVRAGSPRVQADRLDAAQHFRRVLRLDQPDLEVCARGDLHIAGGEFLCDAGDLAQLEGLQQAARDPQPRHEGFLGRREEEQAVPLEAEGLFLVGRVLPAAASSSCG